MSNNDHSTSGSERHPAEKAYDEVLDIMEGEESYEWEHIVHAVFKMKERWETIDRRNTDSDR